MSEDLTDILGEAYSSYPASRVKPGVICIAVIPYVMEKCYVIRPLDPDPRSQTYNRYKLNNIRPEEIANEEQNEWQLPFKDLNLDIDEDLLIFKVKRRPVVVLSRSIVDERQADPTRIQDSFWCLPEYTLVDQFFHSKFNVKFIEDITALTYRSFFPLPHDPHLHDRQTMLRFDRMQPIPRNLLKPTERRLTDEWLLYLYEWACFYITGSIGNEDTLKNQKSIASTLKAAREALMEVVTNRRAEKINKK